MRGRKSERTHGAVAAQAAQRGYCRNLDPARAQAQPRLAVDCEVVALAQQDQALAEYPPARTGHRDWTETRRERSPQVPDPAEGTERRRDAEDCLGVRARAARRPDGRDRLWEIFCPSGARQADTCREPTACGPGRVERNGI